MALFFKIIITIQAGFASLTTGLGAIITALIASSYKLNIFLFIIAFLSYYRNRLYDPWRQLLCSSLHRLWFTRLFYSIRQLFFIQFSLY
ncbi:MAG: hypothetical protein ACFB0B_04410 [Thermonemataceae bacterium]